MDSYTQFESRAQRNEWVKQIGLPTARQLELEWTRSKQEAQIVSSQSIAWAEARRRDSLRSSLRSAEGARNCGTRLVTNKHVRIKIGLPSRSASISRRTSPCEGNQVCGSLKRGSTKDAQSAHRTPNRARIRLNFAK